MNALVKIHTASPGPTVGLASIVDGRTDWLMFENVMLLAIAVS